MRRIIISIDDKGFPEIEKVVGDIPLDSMLYSTIMAAMIKMEACTDLLPEEIYFRVGTIAQQFVEIMNESLYENDDDESEEECDEDVLDEEAQQKLAEQLGNIIHKYKDGEINSKPQSN